uniref:Uncharacterized protein n=1 Tax=Panagrolaimus sp. JU765 TaxID=591449 RepID=A0AC34RGJ7_9BILA
MDDYEYEPFKKLMKLWNQLLKHATIMAGICDALTIDENRFAAVQQPVLHNIENLMKEQRSFIRNSCYGQSSDRICQKGYWPNTVRAFLHEELMEMNEDDVDMVVLADLRDELNHKYQD